MPNSIQFFNDDIRFVLKSKTRIRQWLELVCKKERRSIYIESLNYIFCTDKKLLDINRQFLQHDFYTDVITFDYSAKNCINGEIYISVDRVRENAKTQQVSIAMELNRVMLHGLLHMLGYRDKSLAEQKKMRKKEDEYLLWLHQ